MTDGTTTGEGKVSEATTRIQKVDNTDDLDNLVERASVPNLASLFKRGKEKGLIKATTNYGESA